MANQQIWLQVANFLLQSSNMRIFKHEKIIEKTNFQSQMQYFVVTKWAMGF